jgi:CBS domain containing-hemolysin-like protein
VVDSEGGQRRTVGLVALEDVLELLIGDVRDAAAEHTRAVADRARRGAGRRAAAQTGAGAGGR